jgi:sugar diacid utilization regulator
MSTATLESRWWTDDIGSDPGAPLRAHVAILRQLSVLALEVSDVSAFIEAAAEQLESSILLVNEHLDVLAGPRRSSGAQSNRLHRREFGRTPRWAQIVARAGQTRRALQARDERTGDCLAVAPVIVGGDLVAYVVILDPRSSDDETSTFIVEHVATICGVIAGRETVMASEAGRVRIALLEGLLFGRATDTKELDRWAVHLGYDARERYRVLLLTPTFRTKCGGELDGPRAQSRSQRLLPVLANFLDSRLPGIITGIRPGELAVLLPERSQRAHDEALYVIQQSLKYVLSLFPDAFLTCGLGRPCQDAGDIARSYREALRATEAGSQLGRYDEVVSLEELGIQGLLLQIPDLAALQSFADEVLGSASEYDERHHSHLLETLACFFERNESTKAAAESLGVHTNTVLYRLRRIEEITGLELGRYQDRLRAAVALESFTMLRAAKEG